MCLCIGHSPHLNSQDCWLRVSPAVQPSSMFSRVHLSLLLILGLCIHGASGQEAGADAPTPEAEQAVPEAEQAVPEAEQAVPEAEQAVPEAEDSDWGLNSLRGSFEAVNGYFDSMLELLGGRDGVCQYRCRFGKAPVPRPDYQMPEPNGCSSYFMGLPVPNGVDLGIPAMTKCCNQLDLCYDTCGSNKYRCDSKFRFCLHDICSDLKKSLGFVSKVEACETVADTLFNTVWTLGCRPYMNSQREACLCVGEERDEL